MAVYDGYAGSSSEAANPGGSALYDLAPVAAELASNGGPARPSSRHGKGRASLSSDVDLDGEPVVSGRKGSDWGSDDDGDGWDAWDDTAASDGPRRSTGGRSVDADDDDDDAAERAMRREMKTLAQAEGDGHVASEKEIRKKLYWREAMVTGFFVLLWCPPPPLCLGALVGAQTRMCVRLTHPSRPVHPSHDRTGTPSRRSYR